MTIIIVFVVINVCWDTDYYIIMPLMLDNGVIHGAN